MPVGLYSRAYSLLLLPIGQLTAPFSGVAVPALSRLQDEPEQFKNYYFKTIKIIAYISMPMIISMAILAHEIVYIVLGEKWDGAAELFQILAIAAFWQPVASTVGWVYVSLGNVRRMMIWGLIGTSVMATAIIIGLPEGATGVARAYSISMWIIVYPLFLFAFYKTPLDVKSLLVTLRYPIVVAISSGIGFYFSHQFLLQLNFIISLFGTEFLVAQNIFISLFGTLLGGLISLGFVTLLWNALRKDMFGIFLSIKNMLKNKTG